ncbi:hypothetical protein I79_002528 [Cricetulus griseus]|uniref:Uncharacterized protein n=1 Tax=Cricetulus griseus TaxID=10029 RepID=G3GXN6_CRIGR|nr:hypothetical protein I79_002528 [Cricetulus griseus]
MKPCPTGSALPLPWTKSPRGFACLSTRGCHVPPTNSRPSRPRQLMCTISFSKQLYLLASREYFASTYAPLLLFIEMD